MNDNRILVCKHCDTNYGDENYMLGVCCGSPMILRNKTSKELAEDERRKHFLTEVSRRSQKESTMKNREKYEYDYTDEQLAKIISTAKNLLKFGSTGEGLHRESLFALEESIYPPLETFSGLTRDEWEKVKYNLMRVSGFDKGGDFYQLTGLDFNSSKPFYYRGMWNEECFVVREIGYIQPFFSRLGKPSIPDNALTKWQYDDGSWSADVDLGDIKLFNNEEKPISVSAFIQLTPGTQND